MKALGKTAYNSGTFRQAHVCHVSTQLLIGHIDRICLQYDVLAQPLIGHIESICLQYHQSRVKLNLSATFPSLVRSPAFSLLSGVNCKSFGAFVTGFVILAAPSAVDVTNHDLTLRAVVNLIHRDASRYTLAMHYSPVLQQAVTRVSLTGW